MDRYSVTIRRYDCDGNFIATYTGSCLDVRGFLQPILKPTRTNAVMCVHGKFVKVPPTKRTNVMVRDKGGRLVKWKHLLSS